MTLLKKSSDIIKGAQERSAELTNISPTLDLGNGVTVAAFNTKIDKANKLLAIYNDALNKADGARSDFEAAEKEVEIMNTTMLKAVAVKFGDNSIEYEKAGGVMRSKRKHPFHKKNAA